MKKIILLAFIIFIFGGGLAAYLGITKENPLLTGFGLVWVGIGIILIGGETIMTRESIEHDDAGNITTYVGCSAIFVGILWVFLGLIAIVIGVVILAGKQESALQWFKLHPGPALIAVGLVLLSYGIHLLLGSKEECSTVLAFLISLPGRGLAFLVMLTGLLMVAAGLMEVVHPALFQSTLSTAQVWFGGLKCQMNPIYCGQ